MNSIEDTFTRIYQQSLWGKAEGSPFYSGSGSHEPRIVEPYTQIISTFMVFYQLFHDRKLSVVDVGCGDFAVGRRFLPLVSQCGGLDVVKDLVEHNQRVFRHPA